MTCQDHFDAQLVILFADDTTIYCSGCNIKELYRLVNEDIASLAEWFKVNKLSLNISKTHHVLFTKAKHTNTETFELKLDDNIIHRINCVKFLGLLLDEHIDWHKQINSCKSKMSSGLYALNKVKHILSTTNMRTLYHSLIYPYLNYGTLLWGSSHSTCLYKLEILQKKAIRTISKMNYNAHTTPLFKKFTNSEIKGHIHTPTFKVNAFIHILHTADPHCLTCLL